MVKVESKAIPDRCNKYMNKNSVLIALPSQQSKSVDENQRRRNRERSLKAQRISLKQSVLVHLQYDDDDYARHYAVGSSQAGDGMTTTSSLVADVLFTRDHKLALFLPIADCIGAVLYDPKYRVFGLAHLGHHNLG